MRPTEHIERVRAEYPMYMRYWCCGRTIGTRHSRNCASVPTVDGPTDDQDDIPVTRREITQSTLKNQETTGEQKFTC